jgi:ABC-type transport system involved in multi-copper enzyme maturation permease subunit
VNKILAIVAVTIREALRQKLAVNLLIFALALVVASLVLSQLTFGEQYRIIVNMALSAMEIFGTLIAVFLGAGVIARDVERRTVYPIVAKPVSRAGYVIGRYLGLLATLILNLGVMSLVFVGTVAIYLGGFAFVLETPLLATLGAMAIQFAMISALAVFFSAFTTPTLSAIFTLSLVVAGHVATDLVRYWAKIGGVMEGVGKAIYVFLPNLEALDLKETMVYRDPLPPGFLLTGVAYGLLYAAAITAFAAAVFGRRDLR